MPGDDDVRHCASLQDAQVVAYFLHILARKPESPVSLLPRCPL